MRRFGPRWLAPIAALALALGLRAAEPAPVQELQLRVFDRFQRLAPRPYTDVPVRIVDLDDASLARVGQWPWPRTEVAALVRRLFDMGAAVVAFDAVFAEPDRTSPRQLLERLDALPLDAPLRARIEALPDHDAVLADAFAAGRVVTGFVFTDAAGGRTPRAAAGFNYGGEPFAHLVPRAGTVANLPGLEAAAAGNGAFTVDPDVDGIHRRVPLLFAYDGALYPSLATEAVRVAVGARAYSVKTAGASGERSFGQNTGITQLRIGKDVTVPTTSRGEIWVWYTPPAPERSVPAWTVLDGSADAKRIDGHIVLVGTSASGLRDVGATPLDPVSAGVTVHATVIEQILLGQYLERPDWASGAELVYLAVLGALLAIGIPRVGALGTAALGVIAVAAAAALSWRAYSAWHWLLDPVYPCLAALAVYLVGSLQNYLRSEAQRRRVRGAFRRYLAPSLVDELAAHPEKLRLGGEMREMTLLFCDLRGFTSIAERLDPQALTQLLNRFLTPMTEVILSRRGCIDKYMGDCVMAFWNAPLDDPEHARHACEAALAMTAALADLNARIAADAARPLPALAMGVGVNTGACCVGNMGSDQRFAYSAIGDEVNLASRLEGQSRRYGVAIVVAENTRARVPDLAFLELDAIRVKGKQQPVRIHALLGDERLAASASFEKLRDAQQALLAAYRAQRWDDADAALAACVALGAERGLDELYRLYAERIRAFRATPPPPDWDGVHVADAK
ncbi:MAG: adenylate/guanylate cyclase domain-containing protein [Proteobacteria bacterium]|nr:MAG: adenylate/guanylate cyclase domain-containing protein [Pseudomonadota bacterium]